MDQKTGIGPPEAPAALPNFSDEINHNIIQSEIEGGVYLNDLPEGAKLEVRTENTAYQLVNCGGHQVMITGHPEFCPEPVRVQVNGSSWGGSMLKVAFIGRGMHLEFHHPQFNTVVTSRIVEIRDLT
jgi:GMP synthase-like glutamine amidotransferase